MGHIRYGRILSGSISGAEQADSIQAVVDYNYDLLDAIEVFAPNQMTKERICGALHSSDMEVMVCEPDILKTINLDEVFDSRVRFIALMGARYAEEIIRNMEQHIRANKPQLAIRVSVEYDNLWKLPNVLYDFREDYRLYIRYYDDGIVNDTCVLYAV